MDYNPSTAEGKPQPEPIPTIRECMADTSLPRLELRMLLEQVLQKPRAWMLAHDDEMLSAEQYTQFSLLKHRRLAGEPMAYLLGKREFMDFEVRVAPGVLIPRPQTEHLVETALQSIQGVDNPLILDLGTGSGIIAIALARARPDARVVATDLSEDALAIAKGNIASLGLESRVRCLQGSWYEPLVGIGPFDLIVSNPPYIDVDDHHLEQGDLRFEPRSALTDGHDGLQAIREIVAGSTRFLKPGAALWVEHGWNQGSSARDIFTRAGFAKVQTFQDLAGLDRVTGGICTPDMLLSL